jgi:hypothetical protein
MAGLITSANHPKAFWPGVKKWWGISYDEHSVEYTDLFDTIPSDKAYEEYVQGTTFGLAQLKTQGGSVAYDSQVQGPVTRITNITMALGYMVSMEEQQDNLYFELSKTRSRLNAFSMRQTKEFIGANIYNRAFNATYTGGDGVSLCSTAHPNTWGGVSANTPAVPADLSEASLEDGVINVMGYTNDRGLLVSVMPRSVVVPRQEWFNANRILKSMWQPGTANNDVNALKMTAAFPEGIVLNHYLSAPHAWFIRTNAGGQPGMIYQERMGIQFDQDNDFDTKNAKAASIERYQFGWAEYRSLWGVNGP